MPFSPTRLHPVVAALLLPALLAFVTPARADSQNTGAGSASAGLMFVIHIPVVLRLKVLGQPPLRVTREDIARGFVETEAPQEVLVTSNTTREYALRMDVMVPGFNRVTVSEAQGSRSFGAEGATLIQPPTSPGTRQANFRFKYRFDLSERIQPGDYPWPVQLSLLQL